MYTTPDLRSRGGADAYLRTCASRAVLDVIANKWVCLVIGALGGGTMRFGQLRRRLDGVTQKMLTKTLRELERDGLVRRVVYPSIPPRVEYSLTELGQSLIDLMGEIRIWSEAHIDDIQVARERYDDAAARDLDPIETTAVSSQRGNRVGR
ncbi:winged helix-turn-helix transcriptional regulator [Phytoactinopolyspora halotolerans]|uniref:Helix-turn-helix transcriptional regulator n=1 Tax=Phytoactinopolyspora halotolerans TaxID=1981512 RepID=A0A6L9SGX7_9ACTN|nr:helix-turn-helix domain-containing protein [Phytoactinopolyspora halotolerans]NEE03591.1 helix-turn-helix transcriptional regulator [Phytoactinopolyspora halotolerans]